MSEVHAVFMRRVREEMKIRDLNPHALKDYGVKPRTLADALAGADPRLSTIRAVARAMGLQAADLLREGPDRRANIVIPLHGEPPKMIPPPNTQQADKQDRKKRSR